ncbi:histidine kinase dimerization/phospho-acceptor domain-containing protein [Pantanalinema sp. GBBB05]|uniref:histidine kinase dimerization/phospho-acceptor domain-containing protein n=1 Tax=Pantanalinema sp. GBBB05 TaxID=2604139 RepID=UPI003D814424
MIRNHPLINHVRATRSQSQQQLQHNALLKLRSAKLLQHSQLLITQSQQLKCPRSTDIAAALLKSSSLNQLKTDFVIRVNHEFRTPLTVIATATELLKLDHTQLSDQQRQHCFQQIHLAIVRLLHLLETALMPIEDDL